MGGSESRKLYGYRGGGIHSSEKAAKRYCPKHRMDGDDGIRLHEQSTNALTSNASSPSKQQRPGPYRRPIVARELRPRTRASVVAPADPLTLGSARFNTKMRLPYVPDPPPTTTPEDAAVVARIQSRRASRPLQPLDLALLHSPPVADGWNSFLGAIRTRTSLAADVRELAICRVAVCNEAWYEWDSHAPLAAEAGVSPTGLEVVKQHVLEGMDRPDELDDRQWAVLLYADEMTRLVQVKPQTFDLLQTLFSNREVVEITATVAAYNCVSRFLVALNVGERNGLGPDRAPAH